MSITVKDILQLDVLKNSELIAGKNGLNREVLRVNFTDCPLEPEDPGYKLVEKGDLYIHSFYIDRIADDLIYNIIQFYIKGVLHLIGIISTVSLIPNSHTIKSTAIDGNRSHQPFIISGCIKLIQKVIPV